MPKAKKNSPKLQSAVTSDDIEEQLLRTIIVHPDSRYVRMARPLDREAVIHPHCICRKQRGKQKSPDGAPQLPEAFQNLTRHSPSKEFKSAVHSAEAFLKEHSFEDKNAARPLCVFDAKEVEENEPAVREFYVGNEALDMVALNASYHLRWPLRFGKFDLHEGAGGSRTATATDLEDIWEKILADELGIPKSTRPNYRTVLVIPDIHDRDDVRDMIDILLNGLGFAAVFISLESVASAFGASLASACVVDVGAEKTCIACVEDGISLPETRIMLRYGGDDITRLAHWYFQQKLKNFTLNLDSYADWFKMDAIKKAVCHYDFELQGSTDELINLPSPDREETVQLMMPHDLARFPGLVLFHRGLLGSAKGRELICFHESYKGASDDIYGVSAKRKKIPKPIGEIPDEFVTLDGLHSDGHPNTPMDRSQFLELHRALFWSVSQCTTEEQRKRMFRNIVIAGGGFGLFPGAPAFLYTKLRELVAAETEMIIITNTREIPADLHAFRGAAVMAALETVQLLWVSREEWNRNGTRVLREKCCFEW